MKQSKILAEAAKKQAAIEGSMAERRMCAIMLRWSLICTVIAPLVICFGLRGLAVYIDSDLLYLFDSSPLLSWFSLALEYIIVIATMLFRYAGYGILGYSVLRYGVRPSLAPIFLTLASAAIINLSGVAETVFLYGTSYISSELPYLLPYWLINFFLALFSELCVIFLCAMFRSAFARHGRLRIGITREDKEARRKNVLRRLYLYIVLLTLGFSLISSGMEVFASIRELGAPESFADWFYLCSTVVETVLYALLGYFAASRVGARLTKKNFAITEDVKK